MKLKNVVSVAGFGFIGGILRYLLSTALSDSGILVANLIGCFLLAFLTYYVIERDLLAGWLNVGIGTGLIGAFTTFSSFTTSVIKLGQHNCLAMTGYLLVSIAGGLLMALAGMLLAKYLGREKGAHD